MGRQFHLKLPQNDKEGKYEKGLRYNTGHPLMGGVKSKGGAGASQIGADEN
jgi:hypothetical protein